MNKSEAKSLAWSLYWSQDRLHSCVAANDDLDQKVLHSLWSDWAGRLQEADRVLDLATGNGAVPVALLQACPQLQIVGVDMADIDPAKYVAGHQELAKVVFRGGTDITTMEPDADKFAGIVSQFGIEYAGLQAAAKVIDENLQENGMVQFIIHHEHSEIVKSSALKLTEMKYLLATDGVIETMLKMLRGEASFDELEEVGRRYIAAEHHTTQGISGQVFSGIERLAQHLQADTAKARNIGATLKLRLQSEHDRIEQMQQAAQSEQQMLEFQRQLEALGIGHVVLAEVLAGDKSDYLLGWQLSGQKT